MKVGLVGVGGWGGNHLATLRAMRDAGAIEGLAVCDVDAARAEQAAKQAGAEAFTSPDALLASGVHAVSIVTPTPTHFDLARRALLAGKHVLVEKPMTERPAEAKELLAIAQRTGLTLMPGHLFRYHPGVQWLRQALDKGELGEPRWLEVQRHAFRAPRADMGVLLALGVHELDLFPFLLRREPEALQWSEAGWEKGGIEEVGWLTMRFGGVAAHATESWASPWAGKVRFLAAMGSRGAARIDFMVHDRAEVWQHAYGGGAVQGQGPRVVPLTGPEPLRGELEDFVRCAATGATPLADAASGLRAVELLDVARRSARERASLALR
jgi:UDP-N-acetylglucosamine 3-dehydrogenase